MPAKKIELQIAFRTLSIEEAREQLEIAIDDGFTHARLTVMRYQIIVPKAKPAKPELEYGVPGRIHTHDAQPGKIRAVRD